MSVIPSSPTDCPPEVVDAYDGAAPPTCRDGRGCAACWAKHNQAKRDAGLWDDTKGRWKQ